MPLVSILVPVYNMADYLGECLDSLLAQTLGDIEVVAIDDGSTDASSDILRAYAARDSRIRIIDKPNTGYGDSMNRGLAEASGDYIGIVEPDDFVDRDMYATLTELASRHGAEVVKCAYYEHMGGRVEGGGLRSLVRPRDRQVRIYEEFRIPFDTPFSPAARPEVLTVRPSIWAGVYRRRFLEENRIDFAPTPGASFQDTSFAHKCWIAAHTAVVCRKPLLHYRIDNAQSSVKSAAKVFAVCDEYARSMDYLRLRGPQAIEAFAASLNAMRYCSYIWNYNRIAPEFHEQFAERWSAEMREAAAAGYLDRGMLTPADQHELDVLMAAPSLFCERHPDGLEWKGYRVEGWSERASGEAFGDRPRLDEASASEPHAQPASEPHAQPEGGPRIQSASGPRTQPSRAPFVTVVVPVYQVEEFIRECLESLIRQTFEDFEVIVVDDGSRDASVAIARMVIADDPRFRIVEKANGGLSSARNCGIEQARGTYLAFLDSDDLYVDEALARMVSRVREDDLDYLDFTAHSFYDTPRAKRLCNEDYYERRPAIEGVMSGPELFVAYQRAREYHCSACFHLFKRELLDPRADVRDAQGCAPTRGPLRFEEGIIHEDELFSPLLIARARRAAYLPEALYLRRVREGSIITTERGMRNVSGMFEVQKRLRDLAVASACSHVPGYTAALSQRVAELREIIAEDAARVSVGELSAFAETLDAPDRVEFEVVAIEGARALARQRSSYDARLGGALLKAPRWLKRRILG